MAYVAFNVVNAGEDSLRRRLFLTRSARSKVRNLRSGYLHGRFVGDSLLRSHLT